MPITIDEKKLIELLRECLPYLEFCVGGTDVGETLGKVRMVLELAGQHPNLVESYEAHRKLTGGI
jgi:hypothetical protein